MYRLIKTMQLPAMSTIKPKHIRASADTSDCPDHLKQLFMQKAYVTRKAPFRLIFHSDRGLRCTAFAFRKLLNSLNVVHSFSKKGYPFDNAVCESFFKHLKKEGINRKTFYNYTELKQAIFEYIESYYNSRRPHGSLGYLTPNQAVSAYWSQQNCKFLPVSHNHHLILT
jgi:transposase InsO family protein